MCVDNDSRPPITPIAGGSAGSRDLRLASADGTRFMAYEARAKTPTGAGMIVSVRRDSARVKRERRRCDSRDESQAPISSVRIV